MVQIVYWAFRRAESLLASEWRVAVALGYVLAVILLVLVLMSLPITVLVGQMTEGKQVKCSSKSI